MPFGCNDWTVNPLTSERSPKMGCGQMDISFFPHPGSVKHPAL